MDNIVNFSETNLSQVRSHYLRNVEDFIKIQASIDLMRSGIDSYSKKYPTDDQMAHGAIQALYYQMNQAELILTELNKHREILGLPKLGNTLRSASEQIFMDHYGIDLRDDKYSPTTEEDDDDTV